MDSRNHKEEIVMKKVIIIGAGIAGMSAGIYALQSGFEVTLLEQHKIPGGNCTSWRRGGYLFEGGLHWLTGSNPKHPIHRLWKEVGALTENTNVHLRDPFITFEYNGQPINLYRDLNRLEAHLCSISLQDTAQIKRLCKDAKIFTAMSMPVMDIPGVRMKEKTKGSSMLRMLPKMLPVILRMSSLSRLSIKQYVARFHHPGIRHLLSHVAGEEYDVTALMFTLACLSTGDGGYTEGGSLKLANNMARYFCDLGGTLSFNAKVERILVENNRATGVIVDGKRLDADAVIVASDTLTAIDSFFEQPIKETWAEIMRKNTKPANCTFFCLGVEADLSSLPEAVIYTLDKPIEYAGKQISSLHINNYANYAGYAPDGGTALTVILDGFYDYWRTAKETGSYAVKKKELAEQLITHLEDKLPAIRNKISVWDVATPLTYERYCGTYQGSWMTIQTPGSRVTYPCKPSGIEQLYFAGQRLQPPGGLPVALSTGRQAVQYLCKDLNIIFQGK
jgi:phytoene dehydrogenase-like protein